MTEGPERRHTARREEDRSGRSDPERITQLERDMRSLGRAMRSQTKRMETVEGSVHEVASKLDDLAVIVQEHTPISVDDGAYLAMLRVQYPLPALARLSAVADKLEAQWTRQDRAEAARQANAVHQWETTKQLLQILLGGMVGVAVVVIGLALQAEHVISIPALLFIVGLAVAAGFVVYALVATKAQQLAAQHLPPQGGQHP